MIIIDTGPLLASQNKNDKYHLWALEQFKRLPFPFITCEAVIVETAHMVKYAGLHAHHVTDLIVSGIIKLQFDLDLEIDHIHPLLKKYEDTPMDLADACLVRMAERYPKSQILTIDSDFTVYRKHRNKRLDVIMPE